MFAAAEKGEEDAAHTLNTQSCASLEDVMFYFYKRKHIKVEDECTWFLCPFLWES